MVTWRPCRNADCVMVVEPSFGRDRRGRTGRAGRTARRRVCGSRLLSGHAFLVGAARGGYGARPTDRATGTEASENSGQTHATTATKASRRARQDRQISHKAPAEPVRLRVRTHRSAMTTSMVPAAETDGSRPSQHASGVEGQAPASIIAVDPGSHYPRQARPLGCPTHPSRPSPPTEGTNEPARTTVDTRP
jgi:hypothetical protein